MDSQAEHPVGKNQKTKHKRMHAPWAHAPWAHARHTDARARTHATWAPQLSSGPVLSRPVPWAPAARRSAGAQALPRCACAGPRSRRSARAQPLPRCAKWGAGSPVCSQCAAARTRAQPAFPATPWPVHVRTRLFPASAGVQPGRRRRSARAPHVRARLIPATPWPPHVTSHWKELFEQLSEKLLLT